MAVSFLSATLGAGWAAVVVACSLTAIAWWLAETEKNRHDVAYSLAGAAIMVLVVVTALSLAVGYLTAVGGLFIMTVSASTLLVLFANRPK